MGLGMCGGVVVIEGKGALCEVSDSAEGRGAEGRQQLRKLAC